MVRGSTEVQALHVKTREEALELWMRYKAEEERAACNRREIERSEEHTSELQSQPW